MEEDFKEPIKKQDIGRRMNIQTIGQIFWNIKPKKLGNLK